MQIVEIVRQHPKSVAVVFQHYGHGHLPLSSQALTAMVGKYGEPFAADLANAIVNEYVGNDGRTSVGLAAKVKAKLQNRRNNSADGYSNTQRQRPTFTRVSAPVGRTVQAMPTGPSNALIARQAANVPTVVANQVAAKAQKGKVWQNIKDGLLLAAGIYQTATQQPEQAQQQQLQQQQSRQQSQTLLWAGLAIIGVLLVILLTQNKK